MKLSTLKSSGLILVIVFWLSPDLKAQTSIDYFKSSGISFSIPEGWVARQLEGYMIAGSYTEKGIIIVTPHEESSLEAIIQEARQGINDGAGTQMMLSGDIDHFNSSSVGGLFSGYMDGTPAKAYIVSVISPNGGGLTIMSAVDAPSYSNRYKELSAGIGKTVSFKKPDYGTAIEDWKGLVSGCKLSYYNSYNSGGGSGYQTVIKMSLCNEGYFMYSLDDQTVINGQGNLTGAYSFQNKKGNGTWTVVGQGGNVVLQLNFYDGQVYEYTLSKNEKGHTLLNGDRYLRTCNPNDSYEEARPDCW